jgi:hypothetical protein
MSTDTPTLNATEEVCARARELARHVDSLATAAKNAAKALADLSKPAFFEDAAEVMAAAQKLDKFELPADLATQVRALNSQLKGMVAEEDRRLKFSFGKQLREAAAAAGLEAQLLTTDPPEFRIGLFTVAVDFAKRAAMLRYARHDLLKVPARAEAIVDAAARQQVQLEGKGFDAEGYFKTLLAAYQNQLQRMGQPFGTRVDIVDILPYVAFQLQGARFLEEPSRENFVPYSRVQLAYDLARLRRLGKLSHQGLRLSLGAATGGSTKNKNRVMYLEDERGSGQYYLALRFAREGDAAE